MCLLIAITKGGEVTDSQLEYAAINNPDGFGWAVHTGEHLIRFRSMDIDEAITEWRFIRKFYPDALGLWHLRWATHGTVDLSNCHPFEIGHDARMMVAHNGVLPIKADKGRSDTRILAEDKLDAIDPTWIDDPTMIDSLESYLGGSKLVILSSHPRTRKDLYILNESFGDWEDGVWFSNGSYKPSKKVELPMNFDTDLSDAVLHGMEAVTCDTCECEFLIDLDDEHTEQKCPECGSCYWCGADWCLCYNGSDPAYDEDPCLNTVGD